MKIKKCIAIKNTTLLILFVLSTILNAELTEADAMKNQYIQEHIPVFFDSLGFGRIVSCSKIAFGSLTATLELNAEKKYNLYTFQPFLGYSEKNNSYIQLKIVYIGNDDVLLYPWRFGDPIPLEVGTYFRRYGREDMGHLMATVIVEEKEMDIGIEESGYTPWDTKYKPEKVFLVTIKSLEMIEDCPLEIEKEL